MKINFKIYLSIISGALIVPAFYPSPTYASEIVTPQQVIDFHKDLFFIRETLLESHPGVCNALDSKFVDEMEKNFRITEQKLLATDILEEKIKILREFGRSFDDVHLWIQL